jgi:PAS domain S-box-containing protein
MKLATSLAEAVLESSLDGLAVMDREARYLLWNRAMERFAGKPAAEVLGRRMLDVFPFLRDHGLDRAVERVLAGESVVTEGVEHIEPDGTRKVFDRLYLPLRGEDGQVAGVIALVRDSTARYATRDALLHTQVNLRMASEAAGVGLWSWDPTRDLITWDETMRRLFGLTPEETPPTREQYLALIHAEDRAPSQERIVRGLREGQWEGDFRIVRREGTVRWLHSKARVVRGEGHDLVLGASFDVTERRERDERARATQRLEAIGQLTAGLAHNFNNLLMGLLPNLEMAVARAPEAVAAPLREAQHAAERAANVVRQLMTYAGRSRKSDRSAHALAPIAERTVAFCRTTFDRRIVLEVACDGPGVAWVDASQIEQALLNLLINARDALETARAPRIVVSVGPVPAGAPELEGRPGEWTRVRVSDNGVGIDAATAARIYEPFFTTKDVGKGTGLGLSTTLGIVREHGGFITCRSAPGEGAAFSVYLPAPAGEPSRTADGRALDVGS